MELFFSPLACSMAARIALDEAGADVKLVEVDPHTKRLLATAEDYRAINPLGLVPALRLEDGTVLTENAAILQFVADAFPEAGLAPPESDRVGRARLRQWLSFVGTELHKGLMMPLLGRDTPPDVKAWVVGKYAPRLAYLDDRLKGREFLLDRFSVADAYLATVLNWMQATPEIDLAATPHVKAYLERSRQRPSMVAALTAEVPLFRAEIARRKAA
jgi:glutathione S-transferase